MNDSPIYRRNFSYLKFIQNPQQRSSQEVASLAGLTILTKGSNYLGYD